MSSVRTDHGTPAQGSPGPHQQNKPAPAEAETTVLLSAIGLEKTYHKDKVAIPVLRGVNLEVREGEFLSIVGQSGSGKSTLLHLLATLDQPDAGEIYFEGNQIDCLPAASRDILRNRYFGMIFQFYHLLPELTTLENVLVPTMIQLSLFQYWFSSSGHRARARQLLEMVGLSHRLKHRPQELSGGEMQRAAIARSLMSKPQILLADEPTGNLDQEASQEIMEIMRTLNQQRNLTIVMVTHDHLLARQTDRIVRLVEGRVEGI